MFQDNDVGWTELDPKRYVLFSSGVIFAFDFLLYPFDLLRTREQFARAAAPPPMAREALAIARAEGVRGLWRGFGVNFAGSWPGQLAFFGGYEYCKSTLRAAWGPEGEIAADMTAGFVAEAVCHVFNVPSDVLSQRLQVASARRAASAAATATAGGGSSSIDIRPRPPSPLPRAADELRAVLAQSGVRGLYCGYGASVLTAGLHSAVWFATYEQAKKALRRTGLVGAGDGALVSLASGAVAGLVGVVLTNPLDVVRTRLQIFDPAVPAEAVLLRLGFVRGVARLVADEGLRGALRGVYPRLIMAVPASSVGFTAYEFAKRFALAGDV